MGCSHCAEAIEKDGKMIAGNGVCYHCQEEQQLSEQDDNDKK